MEPSLGLDPNLLELRVSLTEQDTAPGGTEALIHMLHEVHEQGIGLTRAAAAVVKAFEVGTLQKQQLTAWLGQPPVPPIVSPGHRSSIACGASSVL
jgi:hypothetical protein